MSLHGNEDLKKIEILDVDFVNIETLISPPYGAEVVCDGS